MESALNSCCFGITKGNAMFANNQHNGLVQYIRNESSDSNSSDFDFDEDQVVPTYVPIPRSLNPDESSDFDHGEELPVQQEDQVVPIYVPVPKSLNLENHVSLNENDRGNSSNSAHSTPNPNPSADKSNISPYVSSGPSISFPRFLPPSLSFGSSLLLSSSLPHPNVLMEANGFKRRKVNNVLIPLDFEVINFIHTRVKIFEKNAITFQSETFFRPPDDILAIQVRRWLRANSSPLVPVELVAYWSQMREIFDWESQGLGLFFTRIRDDEVDWTFVPSPLDSLSSIFGSCNSSYFSVCNGGPLAFTMDVVIPKPRWFIYISMIEPTKVPPMLSHTPRIPTEVN